MKLVRTFAIVMVIATLLCISPLSAAASDYKNQILALEQKYDQLEAQQKEIQTQIDKAKTEKNKQLAAKNQLDNQIYGVRQQINLLSEKIELLESEISSKEDEYDRQKREIEDSFELLKKRLRVMYKNGSVGFVDVLLGSGSVSEFLSNMEMIQRIYENDVEVMETLQKEHEELEVIRKELKEKKVRLAAQKEEAAAKEAELNTKKKTLEEKEDELLEEAKALEAKLKQMVDASSPYVGGVFIWPVPSSHYITSYAGYRIHPVYKVWKYHSGMDISASGGANILAMGDGKVILSQAQPWYGGYGQCVMIDHGGGVVSLYAHCSKLLVSVGQTVKQGQVIALVGTTGTSTGNHLHVEVRENGTIVDPLTYIQG